MSFFISVHVFLCVWKEFMLGSMGTLSDDFVFIKNQYSVLYGDQVTSDKYGEDKIMVSDCDTGLVRNPDRWTCT